MTHAPLLAALLAIASSLAAQTVDTVGGTSSAPSRSNTGKANMFTVDTTVLLLELEMYLDVPAQETLTFLAYRHHARSGSAVLEWTHPVAVNGTGVGPAWYSTGQIALELVCGNTYLIGAAWGGTVTYHYNTSSTNYPVSFGRWQRGNTFSSVTLPANYTFSAGVDIAQYHMRLTTVSTGTIDCLGTGCSNTTRAPRLVLTAPLIRGTTPRLWVVDGPPSAPAYLLFTAGALATPLPLFGCQLHLDPAAYLTTAGPLTTSTAGEASIGLPIGNDPALSGLPLAVQSIIVVDLATATLDFTGAVRGTVF